MDLVVNGRFLTQKPTGVQRYAISLLNALDRLLEGRDDLSITVFSPVLSGPKPRWLNIRHREAGRFRGNLWEQLDLPRLSRGKMLFCPGNSSPIISLLRRQPIVVTIHDLSYAYFPQAYSLAFRAWYNLLIPLVMKRATTILTVSEVERQSIIKHFPDVVSRIHAIANGGWPDDHVPMPNENQDDGYVLYVGSLSRRKNFPAMFDAAVHLSRTRGFRFLFVGGTAPTLKASSQTIPEDIIGKIRFVGQVDSIEELGNYYRHAGCFIFPSLYESSGLPPLEAMAWGCPVIVSDIPALRERCEDAALYCDPNDQVSMISKIESVMDSEALRQEYRTKGLRQAKSFSWERCASQTLNLIVSSHAAELPNEGKRSAGRESLS